MEDGAPGCRCVPLLDDDFDRHPSMRPLRAWHPNSDGHLCVLLSDGTLHVFDAAVGPVAEQAFRLDPWGRGSRPGPYPLRPEIVDFAFAPPHGWGALSLVLLGREGDVYVMCPFAPWGARYPRVTLESLQPPDENSEVWLATTFPTLRRNGRGADDEDDDDGYDDDAAAAAASCRATTTTTTRAAGAAGRRATTTTPSRDPPAARPGRIEGPRRQLGPTARHRPGGRRRRRRRDRSRRGGALARCGALRRGRGRRRAPGGGASEGGARMSGMSGRRTRGASATLDVLILPQEPSPAGRAQRGGRGGGVRGGRVRRRPVLTLAPLAADDDDGSLQPLLAIDRVELASGEPTLRRPKTSVAAAQNELAPFVSVVWDPSCRDRVFCCAGGAVHGVTLTWLAAVEGAVDEEEEGEKSGSELSLPAVVTLMDSPEVLLGVAPCGDPLAEGLLLAVDATGAAYGLRPAPPLPEGIDAGNEDEAIDSAAASALAGARRQRRASSAGGGSSRLPAPRPGGGARRARLRATRRSPRRRLRSRRGTCGTRIESTRRPNGTAYASAQRSSGSEWRPRSFARAWRLWSRVRRS